MGLGWVGGDVEESILKLDSLSAEVRTGLTLAIIPRFLGVRATLYLAQVIH